MPRKEVSLNRSTTHIITAQRAAPKAGFRKKRMLTIKRSKSGTRVLQQPKRVWYKPLTWRYRPLVPNYKPLPKARLLFWTALKQLWSDRTLFGGIVIIYGLLTVILVRGLSGGSDLSSIKSSITSGAHGLGGNVTSSSLSFIYLLASSGNNNSTNSGVYQAVLLVVCSLAFIWALRSVFAKQRVHVRDSFYHGMAPLIPFLLIFFLMCIQLLPLSIGGAIYGTVVSNGISASWWESILWIVFFLTCAVISLRMLTASVFALYIVTLPDMTPLRAYRSARQLVYGRRLIIWRKVIFLPIALLLVAAVIELPLILFVTPVASWVFFALGMVMMPIVHAYLYNLYREML